MNAPEVVIYTTAMCGWCERSKALLKRKNIPFQEIRVDEDPAAREQMVAHSAGARTVPQIFIGTRHVSGFEALYALDQAGELTKLAAQQD